jgi:hypothetical protein
MSSALQHLIAALSHHLKHDQCVIILTEQAVDTVGMVGGKLAGQLTVVYMIEGCQLSTAA